MTTAETLKQQFPPLLRRGRAFELARQLGCTGYSFRVMCETNQLKTRRISRTRLHYYRDSIIAIWHPETTTETTTTNIDQTTNP